MTKRAESTEETRLRILQASLALHTTKGFGATSWQDIADRAEVSVGTVYYHFPRFDQLIPACASVARTLAKPPTTAIFEGLRSKRARIEALVREQTAYYERARGGLHNGFRERDQIPAVARLIDEVGEQVHGLVVAALGKGHPKEQVDVVEALLDFRVWEAMVDRHLGREAIIGAINHLIGCALKNGS